MITGYSSNGGIGVGEAGDAGPAETHAAGAAAVAEDPAGLSRGQLDQLIERLRRKRSAGTAAARQPSPRAGRLPDTGPYALSFSQQRLWFLSQLDAFSPAYNMAGALDLQGPLDRGALGCALDAVVARHEALRTRFGAAGGVPFQVIDPPAPVALPQVDLAALSASAAAAAALRLAAAEARRPFDLIASWPLRAVLFRSGTASHRLLVTIHHIAADGSSLEVFLDDLGELFAAACSRRPAALPELPFRFVDFAAWERLEMSGGPAGGLARHLEYWRERLAGAPATLELPGDRPRPARLGWRGGSLPLAIPAPLAGQLVALGRRQRATPFMTLLAGIELLLSRHSGQADLVVGTALANRNLGGTERLVGCFVNMLALRADLAAAVSFEDLVARVRAATLADMAHQELPFEWLIEELQPERWLNRTPLFQVAFVLQGGPVGVRRVGALALTPAVVETGTAKFDLTFDLAGGEAGFDGRLEFSAELFDRATAVRLAAHLAALLAAAAARPEAPPGELALTSEAERFQLLVEWNDTRSSQPRDRCIHQLFSEVAARQPDAVAVSAASGEALLTYSELERRSDRLARHLRRLGVAPEVPVAVLSDRSPELVIAVLGILKSGGAYVPLDPGHPPQRLAYVLGETACPVLLVEPRLLAELEAVLPEPRPRLVPMDRRWRAIAAAGGGRGDELEPWCDDPGGPDAARVESGTLPDNLAYVIYTSGSTGKPKGVEVSHANLLSLVNWHQRTYRVSASDRATLIASPAFDASVWELWPYLAAGASLHVPGEEERAAPARLLRWLAAAEVTISFLPTPLAEAVLGEMAGESNPAPVELALRALLTGGDRLRLRPAAGLPFALVNHYGPTETTVVATCGVVSPAADAAAALPDIGRPIDGLAVHVLDPAGQPVPIGVPGELMIGGDGLARGYLRRPDWTAEKFVPDPFGGEPGGRLYQTGDRVRWLADGRLDFLGRLDRQVKIRGFRIEPGEIERVLAGHPAVETCVVVTHAISPAELRLVAYLVAREKEGPPAAALRAFLRERLPEPLVPSAFVSLPALPLNANGKVDRAALPAPRWTGEAEGPRRRPRGPEEELLAGLFADLLPGDGPPAERRERIGIDDSFFDLGGHSLLATRLASRVRETFAVELPLRDVFEAPTVATLAERLRAAKAEGAAAPPPLASRPRPDGIAPLSFAQERLWFLSRLEPESTAYHIGVGARLRGRLDRSALAAALDEVVRRHEVLRTVFEETSLAGGGGGRPVQRISPPSPPSPPWPPWPPPPPSPSSRSFQPPRSARLPTVPRVDLARLAGHRREAVAAAVASHWCERPFDLAVGPLLRPLLLELAGGESHLVLALHHIVADGWSMGALLRELAALYPAALRSAAGGAPALPPSESGAALPPLPIQYADFAAWQRDWLRGEELARQLGYWELQLTGLAPLNLPTDRPPPAAPAPNGGARAGRRPLTLPAGLAAGLAALAARQGVTLFMVLLAGLQTLLARHAAQQDVAVGSPIANRNRAEIEPLIGFFVNTLVMRTDLSGDPTVRELLARVREVALGAYAHQDVPFEKLVERLAPERDLVGTPLFRVLLAVQGGLWEPLALPGLELTPAAVPGRTAKLDLSLTLLSEPPWHGEVEYSRDLFDAATVSRLVHHLEALLAALAWAPERRLSELPWLSPQEQGALLREWNDAGWDRGSAGWGATVHQRVSAMAARQPQAVAVVAERSSALTYGELERRANRLAWRLRRLGVGEESLVGVCLDRGAALVPALLGVHKAGAAYLPLDPELPRERLAGILEDARPQVVLAEERWRPLVEELLGDGGGGGGGLPAPWQLGPRQVPVLFIGRDSGEWIYEAGDGPGEESRQAEAREREEERSPPPAALSAESLAYVLFTSGSTGRPKGVAVTHGALMNVLGWVSRELGLETPPVPGAAAGGRPSPELALLAVTTLTFDIAAVELLLPLLLGGRVELADREVSGDGARLRGELTRRRATLLQATPVTWRLLLEAGWEGEGELRWGITCGEALSAELAERLLARLSANPSALPVRGGGLWNLYGPTETTIFSAGTRVERAALSPATGAPLGGAVANTRLYVLDDWLRPLPAGVTGELYIGGAGLARGYVGRPELTAERFVPDPFADAAAAAAASPFSGSGARLYRSGDLARRRPDGVLEYLGRTDHQVKLRGYRIELGEVEAVLARHPGVRECAVVARGEGASKQLVAYLALRVPAAPAAAASPAAAAAGPGAALPGAAPPLSTLELRGHLERRQPAYMVPAVFVVLPDLPHTASGKVDRRALPLPDAAGVVPGVAWAAPAGPAEELLAKLWSGLLGVSRVGRNDDFFALGGHSLLATQLVGRLREALGVELPVRAVFEAPTLSALAKRLRALPPAAAGSGPARRQLPAGEAPLSFGQERLWFLSQLEPESSAYHIGVAVRLRGRLDVAALAAALAEIVRRHEPLRTVFGPVGGRPVQWILPAPAAPALPCLTLAKVAPGRGEGLVAAIARQWTERHFDLAAGPLFRPLLVELGAGEHQLLLAVHHIAADGWSMGVLLRELAVLYLAAVRSEAPLLAPLPVSYSSFAAWQRESLHGEVLEEQLAYWQRQLAGLATLELPVDRPRAAGAAARTPAGTAGAAPLLGPAPRLAGRRAADLPPALAAAIAALARREAVTPFMVLLAGLQSLLARYTGQTDVTVGSPIAGRQRAEIEPLVGFFVNTLVMRTDLSGDLTGGELLGRVREVALGAFAHQDLPFELLVERLAPGQDLDGTPLFQVMLVVQNTPWPTVALPDLELTPAAVPGRTAKFDLTLALVPEQGWHGELEYRRELFDGATIERLLGHLFTLLTALAEAPRRRLAELPWLAEPERAALLREWNDTRSRYPRERCVHELFSEVAARQPAAVALAAASGEPLLTYAELERRSNRVARCLRRLGVAAEVPVAVMSGRSAELVVAVLGILKSGGAYVPLDPNHPPQRLAYVLGETACPLLLAEPHLLAALPETAPHEPRPRLVAMDPAWRALAAAAAGGAAGKDGDLAAGRDAGGGAVGGHGDGGGDDGEQVESGALPDNLAYVMYTSGSTGVPKGVAVVHRAVVRLVRDTGYAALGPAEVFLLLAPPAFDASTLELWGPLLNGGKLVIDDRREPDLAALGEALATSGVTTLWLTAGLFHQMVDSHLASLRPVRQLLAGGDVLSPPHVRRVLAALPGLTLIDGYGPTEGTTFTCCQPLRSAAEVGAAVPIGRPIANTVVQVVDAGGELAAIGAAGELLIGGDGLARGYLRRPEWTAEKFVPDPFGGEPGRRLYRTGDRVRWLADGRLEFLGRLDRQVKIRGFRIEPGEIERVLAGHPAVETCVVAARASSPSELRLVAYLVARDKSAPPAAAALRVFLRQRLPEPLVPAAFVVLPALPLTANGKVDRAALPEPRWVSGAERRRPPRDLDEELLAGLFADLLPGDEPPAERRERIGIDDSFFDLGGHSLLATRLASRVRETFAVELPLRDVFEAPTVAALAERLRAAKAEGAEPPPPLAPRPRPEGIAPLSFAQERLWFLSRLEPESTAYHIGVGARLRGRLQHSALAAALDEVVRRHEALRTVFEETPVAGGALPVQRIRPPSPLPAAWPRPSRPPRSAGPPPPPPTLPRVDLARLAGHRREVVAAAIASHWCERPFDLSQGPLLRPLLLELAAEESHLVLALHHIVADGWSMGVLLRELAALYPAALQAAAGDALGAPVPPPPESRAALPPLPIQYADFAAWQRDWLRGEELARKLGYWELQLAGLAPLNLPTDRPPPGAPAPNSGARAGRLPLTLPAELAAGLAALAARQGVTLFMVLLAGLQTLLARHAAQQDVAVGSPIANRNRAEIEPLIGFFVNTLVMRTDLSGDPTAQELLARVREVALGAYAHQDAPFEKLVERLAPERALTGTPLFRVLLAVQGGLWEPLALPGLELTPAAVPGRTAKLDLSLTLLSEPPWRGEIEYNRELFDAATVSRLVHHLEALLAALAQAPELRLSELPWLSPQEQAALLREWNDVGWDRGSAGWGDTVHQRVSAVAARQPRAIAVVAERSAELSYGELERRANRLAWRLRRLGVGEDSLVGVCLDRSAALLPALLGVLKAGAAYLPLDPELPRERLAGILEDARPQVVLVEEGFGRGGSGLPALWQVGPRQVPVLFIGSDLGEWIGEAGDGPEEASRQAEATEARVREERSPPPVDLSPESLAYVLFTSGSTGRPKGVAVTHGALMNVLGWVCRELGLDLAPAPGTSAGGRPGAEVVLLAVTTLSFDIAAVELLLPLLLGGRVELAEREVSGDGARLRGELTRRRATLLQATPVTWRLLIEAGWEGEGDLRWGITCGEALSAELAERLLARLPASPSGPPAKPSALPANASALPVRKGGLWNLYGPTETAIFSAGTRVERAALSPATGAPLGGAVANTRLYVLDDGLRPVPAGVTGELYIGGAGLARGYVGRPELTAERFIPDPFADAAPSAAASPFCGSGARLYRSGDLARRRPDGTLEYLGRADHQVKLRGYRIELGEVEAALARHPGVRECAMVARGEGASKQLVAYLAARPAAPAAPEAPGAVAVPAAPVPPLSALELRGHLERRLPAYMVPAVFVVLPELPHTPSGKVDRKALPSPTAGDLPSGAPYVPPRNADEEVLLALWGDLLGADAVERAGAAADFFALGGHSLLATQLLSRVREAFGVALPVRSVFEAPTVAAFAVRLAEQRRRAAGAPAAVQSPPPIEPLPPAERRGRLPLSFAQERLWFLDQLQPGNAAYNIPIAVRLRGTFDPWRFARCLDAVAARHESLRTTFHAVDGQPYQHILPALSFRLPIVDLRGGAGSAEGFGGAEGAGSRAEREARRLAEAEAATPFDLERGPLLRARLMRLPGDQQLLLINMHHIISDGWSIRLLLSELTRLYAAASGSAPPQPPLPVQYADYAAWQRRWLAGEVFASQLDYWRRELAGELPVLELPIDHPRPAVQTFRGGAQRLPVPAPLTAALRALSRREGASLFMTLLAGFAVLLHRFGGQEDILMGIPIAGRQHREIEPLIGFFLNSLVLRSDLSGRPSFRELLRRVRRAALDAFAHQELPFERLLQELQPERDLSRTPLFQVYFNFQNLPEPPFTLPGVEVEEVLEVEELSKFDLTLYVHDDGGEVRLHLVYNAALFAAERIAEALRQYLALLEQAAAEPDAPTAGFSLVTAAARRLLPDPTQQLDDGWAGAVHQHLAAWARRAPDRLAVTDPGGAWTYADLDRQSNRLANRLLAAGVGGARREDPVAIYAHRSATLVWAVLGTLKAGAAFVILDPAYPAARLIDIVRVARPRAWLEMAAAASPPPSLAAAVAELPDCLRLRLPPWPACGVRGGPLAGSPESDPEVACGPESLAYIAFTSGSTGMPKGVLGRHGPLSHFLPWQTAELGLHGDDRFSLLSGLSHDPLQRDLFTPLFLGAAICVPDPAEILGAGRLAAWMREARVSVAHLTPAMGQLLTESGAAGAAGAAGERPDGSPPPPLDDLRFVLLVGDVLTRRDVDRLQRLAPRVTVVNLYGSTETQRAVGYHLAARAAAAAGASAGGPAGGAPAAALRGKEILPCGRGMKDVQLLVFGGGGQLAGVGELGEVAVRSPHLARGYLGDAQATAEKFQVNPFTGFPGDRLYRTGDLGRYLPDGEVAFAGRADNQVKIRGFRIEMGEIEAQIGRLPAVRESVVLATGGEAADKRLVAFVVPQPGAALAIPELRDHLRQALPAFMLPAAFHLLPSLPLTPNGKVDRQALHRLAGAPVETAMHYVAPHNQLEAAIAEILRDVLKVEQVGVEDNFFELGGNSLLLVQAQSRLQTALDREIPVFELFNNPTVRDLARFLGAGLEPPPAADDGTAAQLRVGRDRLRRRLAKAQLEPLAAPQLERHGDVGGPHQPHRPRQGGKEVA